MGVSWELSWVGWKFVVGWDKCGEGVWAILGGEWDKG